MSLGQGAYADSSQSDKNISAECDLIVKTVARTLDAYVTLWLPPDRWSCTPMGNSETGDSADDLKSPLTEIWETLIQRAWETRSPYAYQEDGKMLPVETATDALPGNCTQLAMPLVIQAGDHQVEALGVLGVARAEDQHPFDPEEVALLDGFNSQALIALQASGQIRREHWRLEQLALVRQVSTQIADLRDLDKLAHRVTRLILETFDYYFVAIFTVEPGWDTLHFRASVGSTSVVPHHWRERSPALLVRQGEGIIGSVAQSGKEILATDVRHERRYLHEETLPETRSEMALPLKIENQVLGVLDVQSDQLDDFDETDILVLPRPGR